MKKTQAIFTRDLSLKGIDNEELAVFHLGAKEFELGWCLDGSVVSRHPLDGSVFRLGGPFLYSFLKERYELAHSQPNAMERFGERFEGADLRKLIEIYVGMIKDTVKKVYKREPFRNVFHAVSYDEKKPYTGD
jgi:hypothetical protein